jgi:hypothetical protein
MKRHFSTKHFVVLAAVLLLAACQTIPAWDKEVLDKPVEDGRCPDLSGRYDYEHIKWKSIREWDHILQDDLPGNLPADRAASPDSRRGFVKRGAELIPIPPPSPDDFYPGHYGSIVIYNKIHKGKVGAYPGKVTVTLSRLDQIGRKYHIRVDWDREGLLGEYDFKFNDTWVCTANKFVRTAKSTLYERPDPDEIDPNDYRRIYVLPNGSLRIDRKHTFIYMPTKARNKTDLFRFYESAVFAKIS